MFEFFAFSVASMLPPAVVLGAWHVLRRSQWWVRVGAAIVAFAIGWVGGRWLIFGLIDLFFPTSRSPGSGVIGLPMTFLLVLVFVLIAGVELVRAVKELMRKGQGQQDMAK